MSEQRKTRIGIVGSREFKPLSMIRDFIKGTYKPEETVIVSGGARGVDHAAALTGRVLGFEVVEHLPQIPDDGLPYYEVVKALFARNTLIVEDSDRVEAFIRRGHRSNGTFDTLSKAAKAGRPFAVHYDDGMVRDFTTLPFKPGKRALERVVYFWEE